MANLSSILTDPNYVNANEATKQAIFDKFSAQDTNFTGANAETQAAIRQRFGVAGAAPVKTSGIPGPRRLADQIPGYDGPVPAYVAPRKAASPYSVAPSDPRLKALAAPFVGMYRGLQDIADTAAIAATEAFGVEGAREEAARQKAEFERQYGGVVSAEVGRVGGQVVGTLPVGGLIAAPVKKLAVLAPSLAKFLTPVAKSIETAGFQTGVKPGVAKFATRAVGGGVVGGAAAGIVNPEDAALGATIGAALPAVALPIAKSGVNFARKLKDIKSAAYLDAVENKGQDIVNALTSRTATIVPGSAPTAGEVAATAGGAKFSAFQKKLSQFFETASEYAASAAQTNQARIAQDARVQQRYQNVMGKAQAKIDRNLVDVSPSEVGDALTAAANLERQAVKSNVVQPAYKAAFDAAGDAKIDVTDLIAQAEKILERKLSTFATETAPDTVRKLRSFVPVVPEAEAVAIGKAGFKTAKPPTPAALPPQATLQDLDDVRKAINADIAAAGSSNAPMAPTTLRNLRQLHAAIDDAIGKSAAITDDAKTLYADAVSKYRTEYAPRFKEGVNANLFKRTSLGEDKIRPEDVIARYFTPNGESEARQFAQLFGNNPDALRVARSGIEDVYRKKVAQGGMSHANFLRDYGRTIDIYDNAGMNLRQRFDIINKDTQRLAKIEDMAKASGNKLGPALPPGSNALAVEQKITDLTRGLNNQQLTAVNAVREDIARELEFERLAAAGGGGRDAFQGATVLGRETGVAPTKQLLSRVATIYNAVVTKLLGHVDDKLAMELAREMLNPAVAAESIKKALTRQSEQELANQLAQRFATRAAPGVAQMPANENQNALSR